jgi:superfamily II DNA or RNA helicase
MILPPAKISLRQYQIDAVNDTDRLFNEGNKVVMTVLPTGAGKSVCKAYYARRYYEQGSRMLIFAHRDVLLEQISDKCCLLGVPHTFICSSKTLKNATNANLKNHGDSYWDENSRVVLVSVDTFLARLKSGIITKEFCNSMNYWAIDESHHLLRSNLYDHFNGDVDKIMDYLVSNDIDTEKLPIGNKWGICVEVLRNAKGHCFTATPKRGDKLGLGSKADGHVDAMSVTVTMFDLIKLGSLTPYEIYSTGTIDVSGIKHNKDGELNNKQLYIRTKEADITGDAVAEYRKHLDGKPVITFCVNVEHAKEVTKAFNDAGIPSQMVNAKTADSIRQKAVADLRDGRILNLVNVDLFGEGFDAPAVAGVIMMRRTESYSLFKQQFGRMLRPSPGKTAGILIDMVGNVKFFMMEYGLSAPHDDPKWTLDNERNSKKRNDDNDDDPNKPEAISCGDELCTAFGLYVTTDEQIKKYEGTGLLFINGVCPKCGWHEDEQHKNERKTELKYKKGDLVRLDFSVIDELIKQRDHALQPMEQFSNSVQHANFAYAAKAQFARRQHALNVLRFKIQRWCENHGAVTGQSVSLVQADFEIKFGVNIFKAQTGTASELEKLSAEIDREVSRL